MSERMSDIMLERYLADDLSDAQRSRVEDAVAGSPDTRARLDALRATRESFLAGESPEAFAHRLVARLQHERPRRRGGWSWLLGPSLAVGLVGAAALFLAVQTEDAAPELQSAYEKSATTDGNAAPEVNTPRRAAPRGASERFGRASSSDAETSDRPGDLGELAAPEPEERTGPAKKRAGARREASRARKPQKSARLERSTGSGTAPAPKEALRSAPRGAAVPSGGVEDHAMADDEAAFEEGAASNRLEAEPAPAPAQAAEAPATRRDALQSKGQSELGAGPPRRPTPAVRATLVPGSPPRRVGDSVRLRLDGRGHYAIGVRYRSANGEKAGRLGAVHPLSGRKTVTVRIDGHAQSILVLSATRPFNPKRYAAWTRFADVKTPIVDVRMQQLDAPLAPPADAAADEAPPE